MYSQSVLHKEAKKKKKNQRREIGEKRNKYGKVKPSKYSPDSDRCEININFLP